MEGRAQVPLLHVLGSKPTMEQVLFRIPLRFFQGLPAWWPDSLPVHGFGVMLFLTFIICPWLAARRAQKEGIRKEIIQDLAIWIFVCGLLGARITFMIQYHDQFDSVWQFIQIWKGGIVFYGSAIGGVVGYALAYWFYLRKYQIPTWKLADIIAPSVAVGLLLGRIGCFLNGCCYGNVACPHCPQVQFPVRSPSWFHLVKEGYQDAAGFTLTDNDEQDFRTVTAVDADSLAYQNGLRAGDVITHVNGHDVFLCFDVPDERGDLVLNEDKQTAKYRRYYFTDLHAYRQKLREMSRTVPDPNMVRVYDDKLWEYLKNPTYWSDHTDLALTIKHAGSSQEVELPAFPYQPRTLGLHPTQLYESISMLLLFLLLTAYYPFRRHDGEVMVLFMICYSVHRFLNEMLRNDTDPVLGPMTLSQVGSLFFFVVGLGLAWYLWRKPVQYQPAPA